MRSLRVVSFVLFYILYNYVCAYIRMYVVLFCFVTHKGKCTILVVHVYIIILFPYADCMLVMEKKSTDSMGPPPLEHVVQSEFIVLL